MEREAPPQTGLTPQQRLAQRIERWATVVALASQAVVWWQTAAGLTLKGHLHQVTMLALMAACFALSISSSKNFWLRHR